MRHLLTVAALLGLFGPAPLGHAGDLYAVVFGVVVNEKSQLTSFRVAKVTDPRSGSIDSVNVAIPESFIAAARKLSIAKNYPPQFENGKPKEFFTYYFYDPVEPNRADIDPNTQRR